jgi:ferredoxin
MRVSIDTEFCCGHGRCYQVASELFADDERGYGKVVGDGAIGSDRLEAAHRAVAACPERAISLLEDEPAAPRYL